MVTINQQQMKNTVLVNYQKWKQELEHNAKLRNDLKLCAISVLAGIILGGLLASGGQEKGAGQAAFGSAVRDLKGPGWNPIHVFYGKMDHIIDEIPDNWYLKDSKKHQKGNEWFGQHGQDVAVAKFFNFKKNGFFVDLASNDAVWASNTFALEQNFGWSGICIEANPVYWYRLAFRKNCHVVGSIVGGKDFEEIAVKLPKDPKTGGPFGGIIGEKFDNKDSKEKEKRYTASLLTILDKFNAPKVIDYLSLDVEGAEEFIMKDFPFHQPYTFKVLSIERPKGALKKKLEEAGYKFVTDFKRGDTLWAHKSIHAAGKKLVEKNSHEINNHALEKWPSFLR